MRQRRLAEVEEEGVLVAEMSIRSLTATGHEVPREVTLRAPTGRVILKSPLTEALEHRMKGRERVLFHYGTKGAFLILKNEADQKDL